MKYLESRKARIEIIPMIDIMLFLLVFFVMISMRMIPAKGVAAKLPHSSTVQQVEHPKLLIVLHDDGGIAIDGQSLSLASLGQRLQKFPSVGDVQVMVASEHTASVQQLMAIMDACRQAGASNISLAAHDAR